MTGACRAMTAVQRLIRGTAKRKTKNKSNFSDTLGRSVCVRWLFFSTHTYMHRGTHIPCIPHESFTPLAVVVERTYNILQRQCRVGVRGKTARRRRSGMKKINNNLR